MNSCFSTSPAGDAEASVPALAPALAAPLAAGAVVAPPVEPLLQAANAALPPSSPAAARKLRRGTFVSAARRRMSSRLSAMVSSSRIRRCGRSCRTGAGSSGDEDQVRRILPADDDGIAGAEARDAPGACCVLASRDDLAGDVGSDPELRLVAEVRSLMDPS